MKFKLKHLALLLLLWPVITSHAEQKEPAIHERTPEPTINYALEAPVRPVDESNLWKCSCVKGARALGLDVHGDAIDMIPNSPPTVGGGALFYFRDKDTGEMVGHVGVITSLGGETFTYEDYNGIGNKCSHGVHEARYDDPHLRGFIAN